MKRQQAKPSQPRLRFPPMVPSLLLGVLALLTSTPSVEAARLAFVYQGIDKTSCSSSAYDVKISDMKVLCDGEENVCRPGSTVVMEGHLVASTPLPQDMTETTKACKLFNFACTPNLSHEEDSLQTNWNLVPVSYGTRYPEPGVYSFYKTFTLPNNALTDAPFAGLSFMLETDIHGDDSGNDYAYLHCKAKFTTVNYDTYKENGSTGHGFSSWFGSNWTHVGMVGVIGGLYAGFMARRRHLRMTPAIDLNDDALDATTTVDFEMMGGRSEKEEDYNDADSVRV